MAGTKAVCLLHRDGCLSLRRLTACALSILQFPVIEMCPHDAKSNSGAVWLLVHLSASLSLSLFVCLPIFLSVHSEKIDDVIVKQDDATKDRGELFNWNVRGRELLSWCD